MQKKIKLASKKRGKRVKNQKYQDERSINLAYIFDKCKNSFANAKRNVKVLASGTIEVLKKGQNVKIFGRIM